LNKSTKLINELFDYYVSNYLTSYGSPYLTHVSTHWKFENSRKIRARHLETATHVKENIIIKQKLTVYNPAAKDLKSSHYYTNYFKTLMLSADYTGSCVSRLCVCVCVCYSRPRNLEVTGSKEVA